MAFIESQYFYHQDPGTGGHDLVVKEAATTHYTITNWTKELVPVIHRNLEEPNWASWLMASEESLAGRIDVYSEGQLMISDISGNPLASLSMNRIDWDGNPESLPSWDDVAGDPTTYEKTCDPDGNTLVLMSMNVHPDHKGEGLARKLINYVKEHAAIMRVNSVIGSFRPNEYGKHKAKFGVSALDFSSYCRWTREKDGLPEDEWLRNLTRNGMRPLKVDHRAMTVPIKLSDFYHLKENHNSQSWRQVGKREWECGEVGRWVIDETNEIATYQESNLWGILWEKAGSL